MRRFCFILLLWRMPVCALGAAEPSSPADIPVQRFAQLPVISEAALSPDGSYLAYLRPIDGRNALIIRNLPTPDDSVVVPPFRNLDFDWVHWANNERIVFSMSFSGTRYFTETRETRLLAVDPTGRNITRLIEPVTRSSTGSRLSTTQLELPQLQDDVISWLRDDREHILVALDADFDGKSEVRKINIIDGALLDTMFEHEGYDAGDLVRDPVTHVPVGVAYEARDGWQIPAYLTIPRGHEAVDLPTVVLPHGGPRARDDRSFWFLSQFLASRGYAVLQPNFRGSSGCGGWASRSSTSRSHSAATGCKMSRLA